ncbi:MAG TPA: hypothetical protein VHW45_05505 [Candidatus Sulfotelmatobacter sp.]|jgi:hypothetical protein|nr:hypothetical protein [Candidatus Sulfotelmatobacter sp.]
MKHLGIALTTILILLLLSVAASAQVNASGKITLLRVHDLGTGYGPPSDFIDVEAVLWLDSQPGKAFGFQLRNDQFLPARQGMLDLLRDAFANNWNVSIDYLMPAGHTNNFVLIRAWATKPAVNPIVIHPAANP